MQAVNGVEKVHHNLKQTDIKKFFDKFALSMSTTVTTTAQWRPGVCFGGPAMGYTLGFPPNSFPSPLWNKMISVLTLCGREWLRAVLTDPQYFGFSEPQALAKNVRSALKGFPPFIPPFIRPCMCTNRSQLRAMETHGGKGVF